MNQIGAHYEGHKIIEIGAVEVINRRLLFFAAAPVNGNIAGRVAR
ncbi:hypothetical protein MJN39_25020 [Salmonella enterica subsp. enterica serovar Kentucky]|nr:hypothetical protein [Salmonella enterica subsp. enterica serovar Kentucky]